MSLLSDLQIDRFRCFRKLTLEGLSRVNLIVGANNSGKTALLEAIEWFSSGASPRRLWTGLDRRGARVEGGDFEKGRILDARDLFWGREILPGPGFSVHGEPGGICRAEVLAYGDPKAPGYSIRCHRYAIAQPELPLEERKGISHDSRTKVRQDRDWFDRRNVIWVGPDRPTARDFAPIWREIAATAREDLAVDALRLIEPRTSKFAVIASDLEVSQYGGIVVRLEGEEERVPLSFFGDGFKRLAFLGCGLAASAAGVFLVDEIEGGLHYSVMQSLWKFLVSTARKLDVQVFAATHSKDVLAGLADLQQHQPDLAADVSVHRLEIGREQSVRFEAPRIADLLDMDLEAR
jgi:hypothetical protein